MEIFFGGGEGVKVVLFIPRRVSKHKVQLLPSKVCAIFHLLKEGVANPHPFNKFSQSIFKIKKSFWNFFNFWGMIGGVEGVERGRGYFIHSKNSFKI